MTKAAVRVWLNSSVMPKARRHAIGPVAVTIFAVCGFVNLSLGRASETDALQPTIVGPGEFVVGSDRGLEVWNADGTAKRTVTRKPAPHPRWVNDTTLLVVEGVDPCGEPGQPVILSKIDLQTGTTTPVAEARPIVCAMDTTELDVPRSPLRLAQELDFSIDQSGKSACLRLTDWPGVLAVFIGTDLATGSVRQILQEAPEGCRLPAGVGVQRLGVNDHCYGTSALSHPKPTRATALAFEFKGHSLFKHGVTSKSGKVAARLPEYQEETFESPSPSQRWQLLSGEIDEHDLIYRKLVLVDKRSGAVFPLPRVPGAWPSSSRPSARKVIHVPSDTLTATGESDVRWIGFDENTELLVVDQLILRPGNSAFSVQGNVAR